MRRQSDVKLGLSYDDDLGATINTSLIDVIASSPLTKVEPTEEQIRLFTNAEDYEAMKFIHQFTNIDVNIECEFEHVYYDAFDTKIALIQAARHGRVEIVRWLLACDGIDVNAANDVSCFHGLLCVRS